MCGFTDEAV